MSSFSNIVFSLALIFTIALSLISDRRFMRVEKFLFSLMFTSVMISSLFSLWHGGELPDFSWEDGVVEKENTFDILMADAVRRGLVESIKKEYSLSEEDFTLTVSQVDEKTHYPTSVAVELRGKGIFCDTREMEEYLKEKGGFKDVRVRVRLGS